MKLVVDIQKSLGGFRLETAFTAEDGVTVMTYHGLAMRLTGTSFAALYVMVA